MYVDNGHGVGFTIGYIDKTAIGRRGQGMEPLPDRYCCDKMVGGCINDRHLCCAIQADPDMAAIRLQQDSYWA